jgi:hypothetical protein
MKRPTIVCLCGSTRFWEKFRDEGLRLTLEGKIVLSIGICAPDSMVLANPDTEAGKRQKEMLDVLHKAKIDLADEVLILNVNGYIGNSTRSELAHARILRKKVTFLEKCPDWTRISKQEHPNETIKIKSLMDHSADCDFCAACLGQDKQV